jgi:hypothetical protein
VQEVRQVERFTVREELQVVNELVQLPKEVIHTTIKEIPDIKHIVEKREETTEELMPFSLSPVDRVTELHTVDVFPKVQFVPGEKKTESPEYEQVSVPYELYVPQTEVRYIDREVVRQVPISVPNVKEHAVIVRQCEEREVSITQKDYEVTQHIKHVPEFPMRTEWVTDRHSADVKDEMWHELHLLRFKCAHLGKVNAYLKKELVGYRSRARELGESLASEKQLRQEEERQFQERQRAGMGKVVMSLKPLLVRTDSCPEASRILSPNTSTVYRSAHDMSGISSIGSPHISTGRANQLFDMLDTNHDGVISRGEFYAGVGRLQ